jgi:dihydropteroate synthase
MTWRKASKGKKPLIMGVLNVTPDSFYDGGSFFSQTAAIDHAIQMVADGADIIDVGGESTRPGSKPTSLDDELKRVIPVIEGIRKQSDITLSIDTYKANVAKAAIAAGANMVNDISACSFDESMAKTVAQAGVPVVMQHIKGTPRNMQVNPYYEDVIGEIIQFFRERIAFVRRQGIEEERIIVDPGIGFGKRLQDNLVIIRELGRLKELGRPILIGTSMKSFIGTIMGTDRLEERAEGTLASVAISIWNGVDAVRVHDVAKTKRVVLFMQALMEQ